MVQAGGAGVRLAAGGWEAICLPAAGGSIAALRHDGADILRPAPDGATDPLEMACFPLVPYANRIADGRFVFDGVAHRLPLNFGAHPHVLHGLGWQRPWAVLAGDGAMLELEQHHDGGAGWPWAYRARQRLALTAAGLTATLAVTNLAAGTAPFGLGFHPYFAAPAGTTLQARTAAMWTADPDCLPLARAPADRLVDWAAGADVAVEPLVDHLFSGWDGCAVIGRPDLALAVQLQSPELGNLHIFHPPGADFVCAEPVGHMPDAINRSDAAPGERMTLLAAGATLSATMTVTLAPL